MKKIYRVEIPSSIIEDKVFMFWIGIGYQGDLTLVDTLDKAVPCTEEEHLHVMNQIGIIATAFEEKGGAL